MELFDAVVFSMLMGVIPGLFWGFVKFLIQAVVFKVTVNEESAISILDRRIAETGWCSSRRLGPGRLPADGNHFLFLRGLVIAVRTSVEMPREGIKEYYTLFILGRAGVDATDRLLSGDPRDIVLRYVCTPTPWRVSVTTVRAAPPSVSYGWQKKAVKQLLREFKKNGRICAIVTGAAGAGKSTLGELLAVAFKETFAREAIVVKNLDLTAKGLVLDSAFPTPTINSPVITMFDEFDSVLEYAERVEKTGSREGTSLAENPITLLSLLDRLNRMPHLVVIATTNLSLEKMKSGSFNRYTRPGRFDLFIRAGEAV